MKKIFFIGLIALSACGGSLSDEQRRKIKEDMKEHTIVRVTDAEITEEAFRYGRNVMKTLETSNAATSTQTDSLGQVLKAKIKWVVPGEKNALEIERQLIEAYLVGSVNGGIQDNIQRMGADSLMYTKPVTEKLADGSENVKGMWSIKISKKDLILSMN